MTRNEHGFTICLINFLKFNPKFCLVFFLAGFWLDLRWDGTIAHGWTIARDGTIVRDGTIPHSHPACLFVWYLA